MAPASPPRCRRALAVAAILLALALAAAPTARAEPSRTKGRRKVLYSGLEVFGWRLPEEIPALVRVTLYPEEPERVAGEASGGRPPRPRVTYPMANYIATRGQEREPGSRKGRGGVTSALNQFFEDYED